MTRFVDRGAVTAAYVGMGMALVVVTSFLLVVPIEPILWLAALPAGLLVGHYANARSDRRAGPMSRIVVNGVFAGAATGVTLIVLLLAVKALFFNADDGYRDPGLGGPLACQTGADCVYQRYLEAQADDLAAAGVTDAETFASFYWAQQWATAAYLVGATLLGSLGGAFVYAVTRPRASASPEVPANR